MGTPALGKEIFNKNAAEPVMGYQMSDLDIQNDLGVVVEPPRCVKEDLQRLDRVWRWVARPTVKFMGLRQYTTYSVSSEMKRKIEADPNCPPGISIDVENKLCWREDSWLASIPRKQYEHRMAVKRKLTMNQTELAFKTQQLAMSEAMKRKGADLKVSFHQTTSDSDD